MLIWTKKDLALNSNETGVALKGRIHRRLKNKELLLLKRGLYMISSVYFEADKTKLAEFISSQLYPSYLSLEYILNKNHLLLSQNGSITAVTFKSNRVFRNFLGTFKYYNLKKSLYFGFEELNFNDNKYFVATKAKALFDYFYLNSNLTYRNQKKLRKQLFEDLGIQWANFSEEDFKQFGNCVWRSILKR